MIKHMELCVDLKKQHLAKDALFQYKALTQQVIFFLTIAFASRKLLFWLTVMQIIHAN